MQYLLRHTLLLFLLLFFIFSNAQEIIWGGPGDPNGEFDSGLNDWTAISVSPNDNALWYWDDDGIPDDGAYASNTQAINSASVENGAAVFDSDYLDNGGIQGNFGQGAAAAPQRGELLSPVFSTLGHSKVGIIWTQYMRQFESTFSIEVTNDGGNTWTSFPIEVNNEVLTNMSTQTDMLVAIELSEVMANKEAVQFKFVYEANYYFWIIDDVAVVKIPEVVDVQATKMYYPFNAASIPESFLNADTLKFAVDITNASSEDIASANASVEILDANGLLLYNFHQKSGPIQINETQTVVFDEIILPNFLELLLGTHLIVYRVSHPVWEDHTPSDNLIGSSVIITEDIYTINRGLTSAYSFNSGDYSAFMVMRTGKLPLSYLEYFMEEITFTGADSVQDTIQNAVGNISILKVLNQDGESLDPIFSSSAYGVEGDHENLELVGYGSSNVTDEENFSNIICEVYDNSTKELGLVLEENTTYLIGIQWDYSNNGNIIYTGSSDVPNYQQDVSLVYIHDDPLGKGWYSDYNEISWYLPTKVSIRSPLHASFEKLDEEVVKVFPNPTVSSTTLEFNFKEPTDFTIILRDMQGGYISSTSYEKVLSQNIEYDVSHLNSGTYNFEILTNKNGRTVQTFIKVE